MHSALGDLTSRLLAAVHQVQADLGREPSGDAHTSFADMLDSMALVEYLLVASEEVGLSVPELESCVERRFTTVAALAQALGECGLVSPAPASRDQAEQPKERTTPLPDKASGCWLASTSVRLPQAVETAAEIDARLQQPSGWWESHAGIQQRRLWKTESPWQAAADAGRDCLRAAGLSAGDVEVLLVTSEAPPLFVGLAAAVHEALGLTSSVPALEVGGACTGFVAALWLGRTLLARQRVVLVVAVEAPSRLLEVRPSPDGEAAALFGDGAAASVLCRDPLGEQAFAIDEVALGADGGQSGLIQVERQPGGFAVHLDGTRLASAAIRTLAGEVQQCAARAHVAVPELAAVVVHGGNGRFPALLARQLGVPSARVWSEVARTGNLGSVSLPAAWAAQALPHGPVIWATVGAGLTWGCVLLTPDPGRNVRATA